MRSPYPSDFTRTVLGWCLSFCLACTILMAAPFVTGGAVLAQTPATDLTPTALSGPTSAAAGHVATVNWEVKNQGSGATESGGWYDTVYLSSNNTWDNSDQQLAVTWRSGDLGAGQSYTQSVDVDIPQTPAGSYYLLVYSDSPNYGNYVVESDENNNVRAVPITITTPDLTPVGLTAPASAVAGQTVTVTWEVKNQGSGATLVSTWYGGWSDIVYFSSNETWESSDQQLISAWHTSDLGAGQSYTQSMDVQLPQTAAGSYYLIVYTDSAGYGSYVYEADESNNVRAVPITITTPDLTPVGLTAPASAVAGEVVTVTWEVKNQGGGETLPGGWYDIVYISSNETWENSDPQLTSNWRDTGVGAGQSYTHSVQVNMPQTPAGSYYLILRSDDPVYCNCVYEADESNNVRAVPITITTPDLTPVGLTAPAAAVAGQAVTVNWEVKNQGNGAALGSLWYGGWYDQVYFSSNDTWENTDQQLNSVWREGDLGAGQSYTQAVQVNIPQTAAGSYYLIVYADSANYCNCVYEADESNNVRVIPITVTTPDLTPIGLTAPASAVAGQAVTVTWEVKNQGTGATLPGDWYGGWYDLIYVSADQVVDNADQTLRASWRSAAVAAGATYTESIEVDLPQTPAGSYYLILRVDDPAYCGCVYEADEANNTRVIPITLTTPDLTPSALKVLDILVPGWNAEVSWVVANIGSGSALPKSWYSWLDSIYISQDDTLDNGDQQLGGWYIESAVAPGTAYTETQMIAVPDAAPGTYHLFVRTDTNNGLFESNEANNQLRRAVQLQEPTAVQTPWRTLDSSDFGSPNLGQIDFARNGDRIAASAGGSVLVWDIQAAQPRLQFTGHTASVDSVDFSPSGSHLLSGARDGTSRIWDAATGQQVRSFAATVNQANPAVFSADGSKVFAGSGLAVPRLWERETGTELHTFLGHTATVNAVALSPDGTLALTGSDDQTAILWDAASGSRRFTLAGHSGPVLSVAFSPDGKRALTSAGDSTVRIWDTATGAQVGKLLHGWPGMTYIPHAVFSPDGKYILTHDSGWPGTAYLWDAATQVPVRTFSAGNLDFASINSVAFSPDQTLIATSHSNGQIQLWESSLAALPLSPVVPLTINQPYTFTIQSHGLYYFAVDTEASRSLVISLQAAAPSEAMPAAVQMGNLPLELAAAAAQPGDQGSLRILASRGRLPTVYGYDYYAEAALANLSGELPIAPTSQTKYYVLVYAPALAAGSMEVSIGTQYNDFHLSNITPTKGGNVGAVTVGLRGTGLLDSLAVELVSQAGGRIAAVRQQQESETLLYATFDLQGAPAGVYDVRVQRKADGAARTLPGAFTIQSGAQGRLQLALGGPDVVRPGRTYGYQLEYENAGDADLPAPFLSVSTSSPGVLLASGDYTSTERLVWLGPGGDSPGDVLPPGQGGLLPFQASFQGNADLVVGVVEENDEPFDWSSFKANLKPSDLDAAAWDLFWDGTVAKIGLTNREVFGALRKLNEGGSGYADLNSLVKQALSAAAQGETLLVAADHMSAAEASAAEASAAEAIEVAAYNADSDVKVLPRTTFDASKPTIVITHGRNGTETGKEAERFTALADTLASKYPGVNIVRVTWEDGAKCPLLYVRACSKRIPAVADKALAGLKDLGLTKWDETIYIGESFGNGVNAAISRNAPVPKSGTAVIVNAALPFSYPGGKAPDYKSDFKDSISIQTWDVSDDGAEVGMRSIRYREPKEEHCKGKECDMTGQSHTSGIRLLKRLFEINPTLADLLLKTDWETLQIPDRPKGFYDAAIDSKGVLYLGEWIPLPTYWVNGIDITPLADKDVTGVRAVDPNDKTGPLGVGAQRLVASDTELNYTVNFENMATATAPVQELVIVDYLDSDLDWTTFRFGSLAYSDHQVDPPADTPFFALRDLPPAGVVTGATVGPMAIDIAASFDQQTGKIEWRLKAIDTGTGLFPDDPLAGFLLPEDGSGRGMGHVTFSVKPKAGLAPGASITNKASIVFDLNDPIETNQVANTIGAAADLALLAAGPEAAVGVDEPFTLTLTLFNDGPDAAAGVVMTSSLPSGVTLLSAAASQGACTVNAARYSCNLGDLAAGASAAVIAAARTANAGVYAISAAASASNTVIDMNEVNNQAVQAVTVGAAVPEPSAISLSAEPNTLVADGVSTSRVQIVVKDAGGKPVPSQAVTLTTSLGAISPSAVTDQNGAAAATLTAPRTVGTAAITAATMTAKGVISQTLAVQFVAGPPATLELSVSPPVLPADGVSTAKATAVVKDAQGNRVADQVVGFAATLGSVTATAKSDGAGVAQAVLTSAQQVGQARVTATLGSLTAAADVTFAGRLVSGSIYADLNGNGMRESDEPGLGGIDVEITLAALAADAGEAQASAGSTWHARSDAEGVYAFADLPLGEYNVTVHLPVGFTSTTPATFTVTVGAGPAAAPAVGAIAHVFLPGVAR